MTDTQTNQWAQPADVDDIAMVFGGDALKHMPPREECEAALQAMPAKERRKWIDFQQAWFFNGLPKAAKVDIKDGIDGGKAFRHLRLIQGSFDPKHEHKEAAVAYLASLWFDDVRDYR